MVDSNSEDRKILSWQKDVASSIADTASHSSQSSAPSIAQAPTPLVINQVVTSPPVMVTRVSAPEPKASDEISTKAIIGTMVGATAGAFIAYAMVKGDSQNHQQSRNQERTTYRTIEFPVGSEVGQSKPASRVLIQDTPSHYDSLISGNHGIRTLAPPPRDNLPTPSSVRSHFTVVSGSRGYASNVQRAPIVMVDNDVRSRTSSNRAPAREDHLTRLPPSAPVTEVRIARDVPLPVHSHASRYSRGTSSAVKDLTPRQPATLGTENDVLPSVAPQDSISQVSTSMSKDSGRSKRHHSSHHSRSKTGSKNGKRHEGRASKSGSKHHSKMGDVVEDVISMVKGASIKDGDHYSWR